MADTRKHHRVVRDDLDRQILAALGDDVRPFEAGEHHRPAAGEPAASPTPRPSTLPFGSPLGAFTFGTPQATEPAHGEA